MIIVFIKPIHHRRRRCVLLVLLMMIMTTMTMMIGVRREQPCRTDRNIPGR